MSPPILIDDPPTDDLVEHVGGERCVCKPSREPIETGTDGRRTFRIVHYRLDDWRGEP